MGIPLVTITSMVVTGDELFDLIFTMVVYFGVLALGVGAICSLFRFVWVVIPLAGVLVVGASPASAGSTGWLSCGNTASVVVSVNNGVSIASATEVTTATKADYSDAVSRGWVILPAAAGANVAFECSGYVLLTSGSFNFNCVGGTLCVAVVPSNEVYTKHFWVAGAGLVAGAAFVAAIFRGIP